jgi:hypothetical protein
MGRMLEVTTRWARLKLWSISAHELDSYNLRAGAQYVPWRVRVMDCSSFSSSSVNVSCRCWLVEDDRAMILLGYLDLAVLIFRARRGHLLNCFSDALRRDFHDKAEQGCRSVSALWGGSGAAMIRARVPGSKLTTNALRSCTALVRGGKARLTPERRLSNCISYFIPSEWYIVMSIC